MDHTFDARVAISFYRTLFGDMISAENQLTLWTPRTKRTTWCENIAEAVAATEGAAAVSDLYFGCCLQDKEAAQRERSLRASSEEVDMEFVRGYAQTTTVMGGLWLDLDIAGDEHKKVGLPKTQAEADRIVAALPLPPSMTLRTGGGTHIYWVFKEPWHFESEEERDRAAALVRGWQTLAIDVAADMGFVVDATHDLSRVLRPLGTINHKYGKRVELLNDAPIVEYNPSDFEDW